jgi:UDP-glucose 4-epimerase
MNIIVTGGFGYIGSHICLELIRNSHRPIVIDNSRDSKKICNKLNKLTGVRISYYNLDLTKKNLDKIFSDNMIDAVIHMAAFKSVEESVKFPLKYYNNNILSTTNILNTMSKFNVNKLIFSSSATVYGDSKKQPLKETNSLKSLNPYGATKIICEQIITDYLKSNKKFRCISLRYFNPIGADRSGEIKEFIKSNSQNIMPKLIECAKLKKTFKIFGNKYKTKDGTCIRDYIHVSDLALAHIESLKKIHKFKDHKFFNVGTNKGYTVLELIKTFEKINDIKINYKFSKPRNGDSPICYADSTKIKKELNWKPKYKLDDMCKDAWNAEIKTT